MKLSVGIITYNEERNLPGTLGAVKDIADEIIIVDSHSTDNTVKIAERYGAKIYIEDWKGFGAQKNSAIDKCHGEWILLIDADEEVSTELKARISSIVDGAEDCDVYSINRCAVCFGKEQKYGGWSNQYAVRLWRNGCVRVSDNLVHEDFITDKEVKKVSEKIFHHTYLTMHDYFERFNKYTTLGAQRYYREGKRPSVTKIILSPLFKFIRMYVFRLGFLDGVEGLAIASTSAMYCMVKYFKLREMHLNNAYNLETNTSGL
jgi:glycosyltransferase involved in cell wall biosynthesis